MVSHTSLELRGFQALRECNPVPFRPSPILNETCLAPSGHAECPTGIEARWNGIGCAVEWDRG